MTARFGDIRDSLVALPHNPWDGFGGSYVEADLFPIRHELVAAVNPRLIFEFGGFFGYCLVTMLDAAPECEWLGWCDNERDREGSNELCAENIRAYLAAEPRRREPKLAWVDHVSQAVGLRADVVAVDGDHTFAGCLADLTLALTMKPRLILVDDYSAIGDVRSATDAFAAYFGLEPEVFETVNGLAVFRPD